MRGGIGGSCRIIEIYDRVIFHFCYICCQSTLLHTLVSSCCNDGLLLRIAEMEARWWFRLALLSTLITTCEEESTLLIRLSSCALRCGVLLVIIRTFCDAYHFPFSRSYFLHCQKIKLVVAKCNYEYACRYNRLTNIFFPGFHERNALNQTYTHKKKKNT